MSLKTEFDKLKYDTRMLDINLNSKSISPSDIENHLASLEDCSDNAVKVNIDDNSDVTEALEKTEPENNIQQTSYGQFDPNNPLG